MGLLDPRPGGSVTAAAITAALGYTPLNIANLEEFSPEDVVATARSGLATKAEAGVLPASYNSQLSYPRLQRRSDVVVGTKTQVGLNSLYTPVLIRVPDSVRANFPEYGKWRVYTSTDHDSADGGIAIGISTNDDPLVQSGWSWLRNSGSAKMFFDGTNNQTETPFVWYNEAAAKHYMYYQRKVSGTTQGTYLATSTNGVTGWTVIGQVLKNTSNGKQGWNHTGYAKFWNLDGLVIAYHLAGSGSTVRDGYTFSYSYDGINFIQDEQRMAMATQMTDGSLRFGLSALYQWRGNVWGLGTSANEASGSTSSTTKRIWVGAMNAGNDFRSLSGRPIYLDPGAPVGGETSAPGAPSTLSPMDDGRLVGATLVNGENGFISLAVLA